MKRLIALALASTTLASCVSMAPEHIRPVPTTASTFDSDYRPDGEAIASQLSYREWFLDPRLQELVAHALENNSDLLVATARIEQARARYRIQDSRRLPSIVADASAVRTSQPLTANPALGTGDVEGAPDAITFNRFDAGVGVSVFELDFWGRIANLSVAARAEYLATVAAQRAFYLSLIVDTAATYYEIVETQEQIALAEATAESRREGLRIARVRLESGVTSALPFRQAETLLTQAEQQLASKQLALAWQRNQLAVLVGSNWQASSWLWPGSGTSWQYWWAAQYPIRFPKGSRWRSRETSAGWQPGCRPISSSRAQISSQPRNSCVRPVPTSGPLARRSSPLSR